MRQLQTTKADGSLVRRARVVVAGILGAMGAMGVAGVLPGCADEPTSKQWSAGARPSYEERELHPATLDEVKGGSSLRVWGSGTTTTTR